MNDAAWELYDGLVKALHAQGRRIEALETHVESLLREGASRSREADTFGERPILKVVEPEQIECGRCSRFHSPELPCVTPADEAWRTFGGEVTA